MLISAATRSMSILPPTPPIDAPPVSIPVGITIGLLASLVQSLGLTIQRKSHVINERKPEAERTVEHRRPLWLIGFGIFISSNLLGSLFQIASLPVVILAPLGAVSLLWNAFFARLLLGDVFSPYMILGTIAIAGGAVLIAVFGIVPEPTHSLESLLVLFARGPFIVYFSLLGATVIGVLAITHIAEFSLRHRLASPPLTPPRSPSLLPVTQPSLSGETTVSHSEIIVPISERTPLLQNGIDPKAPAHSLVPVSTRPATIVRTRLLLAISYASISGILSGMCLLFAKSGVELLILTAKGDNQFWRWEAWALVGGLVAFSLLQLWYLHKSLILANPILVCPLAFCFYNLSSIVNGLIYYDQFGVLTRLHLGLVVLGIFVLLGGVWAVSVTSGDGGVEPGTWREGDEEEEEVLVTSETPEFTRSVSYPTVPTISTPLSPGAPSDTLSQSSPSRSKRRKRYGSIGLLGSEGQSSLGGLSIGLSPTSPGFALKPTKRRRSSSGMATMASEVRMRRAASEADVLPTQRARARWKWLKNVWRSSVTEGDGH